MGVLNVTPDSFSDGGSYTDVQTAVAHGIEMADQGADIIDVGGESTRPGALPVPQDEELRRVMPVLEGISRKISVPLSIDTTKAEVARCALEAGADIVNDVSALRFDPDMAGVVAYHGAPVVLMHMPGDPRTMQQYTRYRDIIGEVAAFLKERIAFAERAGIGREKIIIDPGIGFGKSLEKGNFLLLDRLGEIVRIGQPVLVGPSRKAFIGRLLDKNVDGREEGTAAAVAVAVYNGAHFVRVHRVGSMQMVVRVVDAIKRAQEQ
jgi:dihydropteroate synthase